MAEATGVSVCLAGVAWLLLIAPAVVTTLVSVSRVGGSSVSAEWL